MSVSTPAQLSDWSPSSWRSKIVAQDVTYPDSEHLGKVLAKLSNLPPLVSPSEIERLRHQLSQVQQNQAFLLHAGDCAESFDACTNENIRNKISLILSFSLILVWGARVPVVRIGRIAGQYAKPRSSPIERISQSDGSVREVLSFRGDNVNGLDIEDRTPDPERLLKAYFHSSATLNHVRSLLSSGFASLHHSPHVGSLTHVRSEKLRHEFDNILTGLSDALDFSRTIGATAVTSYERGGGRNTTGEVDFYVSHEGLMLNYEQALTREHEIPEGKSPYSLTPSSSSPPASARASTLSVNGANNHVNGNAVGNDDSENLKAHYNTSAHFLWIGDRTRQLTGAHIEYFRGIRNPIGIKVGPSLQSEELINLLDIVNSQKEPGKVTLITRYGASKIQNHLPGHIEAVHKSGHPVAWVCDPMHGNTETSTTGLKTRHIGTIIGELTACLRIHNECGSRLGGVSLEFTGELNDEGFSVTECVGGSMELKEDDLGLRYQSFCDPRLNIEQSLDIAFLVSNHFKKEYRGHESGQADVLYTELQGRS